LTTSLTVNTQLVASLSLAHQAFPLQLIIPSCYTHYYNTHVTEWHLLYSCCSW